MKNKARKIMTSLAIVAVLGMPIASTMAASKTFTNYAFTTIPYSETYKKVVAKEKADNEQNWYVYVTSSNGLGTTGEPRAIFSSAPNKDLADQGDQLGLYANMRGTQRLPYGYYVKKGTNCKLFVTGNNNGSKRYTITLSGRYTS